MQLVIIIFLTWFVFSGAIVAGEKEYVGSSVCADCHSKQVSQWYASHHGLAMQLANERTVLGDFDNDSLNHFGVKSSFFKKDDKYIIRTEGPNGKIQDYEIKYTFGIDPLQQYLIEFPGARLQAVDTKLGCCRATLAMT